MVIKVALALQLEAVREVGNLSEKDRKCMHSETGMVLHICRKERQRKAEEPKGEPGRVSDLIHERHDNDELSKYKAGKRRITVGSRHRKPGLSAKLW